MSSNGCIKGIVNGKQYTRFQREYHPFTTSDGMTLMLTRKIPVAGVTKPSPMVFVHGLGQNRFTWDLSRRSMENYFISMGYETYNVELRGHGLSRISGSTYPHSFEEYSYHDIPAALDTVLALSGASRVFYCGHSLGGTVAYSCGARLQDKLAGIITIGGPVFFGRSQAFLGGLARFIKRMHDSTPLARLDIPYFPIDLLGSFYIATLFYIDHPANAFPYQIWYPRSIERDLLIERLSLGFDRTGINIIKVMVHWAATGKFENLQGEIDFSQELEQLDIPILFVAGNADTGVPLETIQPGFQCTRSQDKTLKVFNPTEHKVPWGHCDLICGKLAPLEVWPYILDWTDTRQAIPQ